MKSNCGGLKGERHRIELDLNVYSLWYFRRDEFTKCYKNIVVDSASDPSCEPLPGPFIISC